MINYFRKLVSGYSMGKKNFRGQEYRFRYQGKPVFFDPIQMVQEFHHRKANSDLPRFPLGINREKLIPFLPELPKDLLPSVICLGKKGDGELEIARFTFKRGLQPVSLYRFHLDGIHVGDFYRIYDYGSETQNFMLKVASLHGNSLPLSQESVIWENDLGEAVFIEKFGHTQIWN